jgi:hypothetical protein
LPSAGPAKPHDHRGEVVGALATPWNPDFDVLVDPTRRIVHFLGTEAKRLKYLKSMDGGRTWSAPKDLGVGWAPRMALDSRGNVHIVFGNRFGARSEEPVKRRMWDRFVLYASISADGTVVPPRELVPAPLDAPSRGLIARGSHLVIDHDDNVHVLFGVFPDNLKELKFVTYYSLARGVYMRKPAAQDEFEPAIMLKHLNAPPSGDCCGANTGGDLVVDSAGDVHLLYASWSKAGSKNARTTHLVRKRDGTFSPQVDDWIPMSGDHEIRAAIDRDDVIHVAGFDPIGLKWIYCNNRRNRSVMEVIHAIDDDWEINASILLMPDGDVWMARENHYGTTQEPPPKPGGFRDKAGLYVHYDSQTSRWTSPTRVSADPAAENSDAQYGQAPKFTLLDGTGRTFYPERPGSGGNYVYRHRVLEGAGRQTE